MQVAGVNQRGGGRDDFINFSCFFAPHSPYHHNQKDQKPSAGISISDTDESFYHCYTCDNSGSLSYLLWKLNDLTKTSTTQEALEYVREHENNVSVYHTLSPMNDMDLLEKTFQLLNEFEFPDVNLFCEDGDIFDTSNHSPGNMIALDFMLKRGFTIPDSKKVLSRLHFLELRGRLYYLQIDFVGNKIGVLKIKVGSENQPKYKIFYDSHFYLLNEQCLQGVPYRGVNLTVAEGIFDIARLLTRDSFTHVVGIPGKIGVQQTEKILYFSRRLFMFVDCDPTGYMNLKRVHDEAIVKRPDLVIMVFNMFSHNKEDVDSYFSRVSIHSFDFQKKDVFVSSERYLRERSFLIEKKPKLKPELTEAIPTPVTPVTQKEGSAVKIGLSGELES